jgi:hypothetical protein
VAWTTGGRARDGQPPSPLKKKKEEGTCNSSLIKIIFRPIIYFFSFPMLLRLFAPLLGPHRNAAKELKSGKMEGT